MLNLKEWMAKISQTTLIGEIKCYAGSDEPEGWMKCDGSAVSRTKYRRLFEVIGTTYGNGDGSTTFNLPDMRGRSPLGVGNGDATGHTNHTLGQKGGEETHTLNVNEMPSHRHRIGFEYGANPNPSYGVITQYNQFGPYVSDQPSRVENTGGGQPHNIMHPYLGINFLIYVGGVLHSSIFKAFRRFASLRKGGGVNERKRKGTALKSGEHYITGEYNRPKPGENSNYTHCKLQPYNERSDLLYVCAFSIYDKKHELRRILSSHISSVERRRRDNKRGTAKNDYWRSVRSRNYRLQQPCVGRPDNNHYIRLTSGRGWSA